MINYYLLMKPGIIMGNLITVAAGFLLAAHGVMDVSLFFATLLGLALVMGSACVWNNFIDRPLDRKMKRTQNRPLVKGTISSKRAVFFGICLGLAGVLILQLYTNLLTVCIASVGFFVYVVLYSLWKGKTIYATAIGSIAGAVPPLVGYCAVSNHFDIGAVVFFAILVLWQMPHFFAIALVHFEDYQAASIPAFPIKKGAFAAKKRMLAYILAFTCASLLLTFFEYTGYFYMTVVAILGTAWTLLALQGFKCSNDKLWAKKMFRLSLVIITLMSLVIPLDLV
jgi:protoheme IX farnesyltransferase